MAKQEGAANTDFVVVHLIACHIDKFVFFWSEVPLSHSISAPLLFFIFSLLVFFPSAFF